MIASNVCEVPSHVGSRRLVLRYAWSTGDPLDRCYEFPKFAGFPHHEQRPREEDAFEHERRG